MARKRARQTRLSATKSSFTECPVCSRSVPVATAQLHVESCLAGGASEGGAAGATAAPPSPPPSSPPPPPKRSAFDVLRRARGPALATLGRRPIELSDLPSLAPAELILDAVPTALADAALVELLALSETWRRGRWWLFGQSHEAPRVTKLFGFPGGPGMSRDLPALAVRGSEPSGPPARGEEEPAPAVLHQLRDIIEALVEERREAWLASHASTFQRPSALAHSTTRLAPWRASYVLVNVYRSGEDCVGSHGDHLTDLGPLPLIASLTLGAQRPFRLKKARGSAETLTVELPHGSLFLMYPGCQEQWMHELPRTKRVVPHPLSGDARVNLTLRRRNPECAAAAPKCLCGKPPIMKTRFEDGRYFYKCNNARSSGEPCDFFQWASF